MAMATRGTSASQESTNQQNPSTPENKLKKTKVAPVIEIKSRRFTTKDITKDCSEKSGVCEQEQSRPSGLTATSHNALHLFIESQQQVNKTLMQAAHQHSIIINQVKDQLQIMTQQNKTLQEGFQELKKENAALQNSINQQNSKLDKGSVQIQQDKTYSNALQAHLSPPPVQNQGSQPSKTQHDTLTINATRTKKDLKNAETVKNVLQKALRAEDTTKDINVQGLKLLEGPQLLVQLASKGECEIARINTRWLEKALPGARVRGETWYPVKIDGVYKNQVTKENETGDNHTFKDDILETFTQDNAIEGIKFKAMKIAWLSKQSPKLNGSLLIWLSEETAVNHLLRKQITYFGPTIAQPAPYEPRAGPERCYRCNHYGHRQFRCTEKPSCGICAKQHSTSDCKDQGNPCCTACKGPHTVMDKGCPVYQRQRNERKLPTNPSRC